VALSNGNYVMFSTNWANGGVTNAGAVTWGNGVTGSAGVVTADNSLVGGVTNDQVGYSGVITLSNGNYVVRNLYWTYGGLAQAGAVTLGDGGGATVGLITGDNSVRGVTAGGGPGLNFSYDAIRELLVVGRPADNLVTLFTITPRMLTVTEVGNGTGMVTSQPGGLACGPNCTIGFIPGTVVTLTAAPAENAFFAGWSGAVVTTTNPLVLTMDTAKSVTATFGTYYRLYLPTVVKH
jgi:hypothetical protein